MPGLCTAGTFRDKMSPLGVLSFVLQIFEYFCRLSGFYHDEHKFTHFEAWNFTRFPFLRRLRAAMVSYQVKISRNGKKSECTCQRRRSTGAAEKRMARYRWRFWSLWGVMFIIRNTPQRIRCYCGNWEATTHKRHDQFVANFRAKLKNP